jgi:hypothetical protein
MFQMPAPSFIHVFALALAVVSMTPLAFAEHDDIIDPFGPCAFEGDEDTHYTYCSGITWTSPLSALRPSSPESSMCSLQTRDGGANSYIHFTPRSEDPSSKYFTCPLPEGFCTRTCRHVGYRCVDNGDGVGAPCTCAKVLQWRLTFRKEASFTPETAAMLGCA